MEDKEFSFFWGRVRFKQPKEHRLSIVELLFLANIKGVKRKSKVVDLGAGFGTLSILTAIKYGCNVWAVEKDKRMLELLRYNVSVNQVKDKVHLVEGDVHFIKDIMPKEFFDVALINPPFYPKTYKYINNRFHFEKDTELKDFLKAVAYLLKDGGALNLLYTTFRLVDTILCLRDINIMPTNLRIFYPKLEKYGKFFRLYGIKNGRGYMTIEKPLIINENTGEYTEEVKYILNNFFVI
ncbi:MAG: tRNA1(Val) (adenine(37)-N6)-methyltransferase [Aquificaceae bacterium]